MCRCHTTLWYIQSSLQGEAAVESVAMKSRHNPRIVGANMKTLGYREGGGCWRWWWYCKSEQKGAVHKLECELYWFA